MLAAPPVAEPLPPGRHEVDRSPTGVLIPIRVPRLPRRPHRFGWDDATWARCECTGPSFEFTYRQARRALSRRSG